jgi:uncharacterized protein YutE (UPF0331/DUF86 family)
MTELEEIRKIQTDLNSIKRHSKENEFELNLIYRRVLRFVDGKDRSIGMMTNVFNELGDLPAKLTIINKPEKSGIYHNYNMAFESLEDVVNLLIYDAGADEH